MKLSRMGKLFWLLIAVMVFIFTVGPAMAQTPPPEKRTVYVIGNLDGAFSFPIIAYIVVDQDIYLADTWSATMHNLGPVGLAVDENNENLFVSYESFNGVEVFDARDATPLGTITLWGTDDLAGMVVHQDRGHLYVVDRREKSVFLFDTTTFTPVDQWILPTGNGAWGIDLMGDWLFVTDMSGTVRYYDIDTHQEVGNFTLSYGVTGIAVTDYPEPLIFCQGHDGGSGISPYFIKYALNTGIEELLPTGNHPKGVTINPATELGYSVADNRVHVIDTANMVILQTKQLNYSWNPTDTLATFIPFGGTVQKTCTTHPAGKIMKGDTVTFNIAIQNRHALAIHVLPLSDSYDHTQLTYESATLVDTGAALTPSGSSPGYLEFADLIVDRGSDLPTGEFSNVEITFTAIEDCDDVLEGVNTAMIFDVEDVEGTSLPDASGQFDYEIDCNCKTNLDCDDGVFCNGQEICLATGDCESPGNPCPLDDGLWCNGDETADCDEDLDECGHENVPCEDDGLWCNGTEVCNEDTDSCTNSGPPCDDDGQFCNGDETCNDNTDQCDHSGNPCPPSEECNETTDACDATDLTDDDDTGDPKEEDLWPKGKVTGGYCGCE